MSTSDQVVDFVEAYITRHGYSPTVREIAAELGRAPSTIHAHVIALAGRGALTWEPARPRTIRPREAA